MDQRTTARGVNRLRHAVVEGLLRHGLTLGPEDSPASLRERLNDLYVQDVRRLKARLRSGEITRRDYAGQVQTLSEAYPLLGLPPELWVE
jgi:hypothetical protein